MIGRLGGGGSDFQAFIQHVGVPAVDMRFGGGYPVYHSLCDDFNWMQKFGDPMFKRHVAAASIWGLLALKLVDEEFLPFDYLSYAYELKRSTNELEDEIMGNPISLTPLYKSIEELKNAATNVEVQIKELERKGWASMWGKDPLKVRELNDRLMMTERAFTDRDGLFERPWYKHLVSLFMCAAGLIRCCYESEQMAVSNYLLVLNPVWSGYDTFLLEHLLDPYFGHFVINQAQA